MFKKRIFGKQSAIKDIKSDDGWKYIDRLKDENYRSSVWRMVSIMQMVLIAFLINKIHDYSEETLNKIEETKYILAPGIQVLTTVKPGIMPVTYIESLFKYVAEKMHDWTFATFESNYSELYREFYSPDVINLTEANFNATKMREDIKSRRINSFWEYNHEKSEYHWCDKVQIYKDQKGVACGLITGTQKVYTSENIPLISQELSYLFFAINKSPSDRNVFSAQITRIRRESYEVLKKELSSAIEKGVVP